MVTDITCIPTAEGWLFLAAEIDLFSRRVLGWPAHDNLETGLVLEALDKAVAQSPGRLAGLIHHRDQGSQYASHDFTTALADLAITQSMSRRGNCYDNATAESFWATLKTDCFNNLIPNTRATAKAMIFDYIQTFCNPIERLWDVIRTASATVRGKIWKNSPSRSTKCWPNPGTPRAKCAPSSETAGCWIPQTLRIRR